MVIAIHNTVHRSRYVAVSDRTPLGCLPKMLVKEGNNVNDILEKVVDVIFVTCYLLFLVKPLSLLRY
jgi:hypothetical protein